MRNLISAVLLLLALSVSARAYTDTGGRFTAGPDGYSELNFFAESGDDDYYLSPSLTTCKSDFMDRYYTYSLGAGLDRPLWRGSAELSITPEVEDYKKSALYTDLSFNLLGEPEEGAALEDVSLGAFGSLTLHEGSYSLSTATVISGRVEGAAASTLPGAVKLTQTDYGLTASVRAYGVRVSGRFTKTAYNRDIPALDIRLPIDTDGTGGGGYQDKSVSARVRFSSLPLSPECGYVKTYYLLTRPNSESFNFGLSQKIGAAELSAGWENFNPGGGAARSDYYSLGVAFSF